eukprot:1054746-Pleurochrysis_carterae.AAC.1
MSYKWGHPGATLPVANGTIRREFCESWYNVCIIHYTWGHSCTCILLSFIVPPVLPSCLWASTAVGERGRASLPRPIYVGMITPASKLATRTSVAARSKRPTVAACLPDLRICNLQPPLILRPAILETTITMSS